MPTSLSTGSTLGRSATLSGAGLPRRLLFTCAALTALVLAAILCWPSTASRARSLDDVRLTGARGPACERFVIANDVSGSMNAFAQARTAALAEIRSWSARNLRADDQLGVVDFAGNAVWQSRPASIDAAPGAAVGRLDGSGTNLLPVLDLIGRLPHSSCDTVVTFLSDGLVSDLPGSPGIARRLLATAGVHDVFFLVPGKDISVNAQWSQAFPAAPPVRFDGLDAAATGLAFGRVVSVVTRQQLEHV